MPSENTRRIVKNTGLLYVRMFLIMGVTLYTSRVVLNALGIVDYGVYNVVGGVVTMFTFFNTSLSGATARFITFELGKKNMAKLQEVFTTSLIVHIGIAVIVFILAETLGLWLLRDKLVIPQEREWAAYIVYQISVLTCTVSITQVPYNAIIIAYERMKVFTYVSILDVSLKLLGVYLLVIVNTDKLVFYGVSMFIVTVVITLVYRIYCVRHFPESRFRFIWNKKILLPILTFSGWDLYANMSAMMRGQGVNILQNIFFGPIINSATGVANQLQGAVNAFADNFLTAVRPQIVKDYACENYQSMLNLVHNAAKYSFILLFFCSLPLIIESKFILQLWLKNVPDYTVIFCQLSLIGCLILVIFRPVMFSIHAVGKVTWMSIVNGSVYLLVLPITYILFRLDYPPLTPFVINICLFLVCGLFNLWILKAIFPLFSIYRYLRDVVWRCFLIALFSTPMPIWIALRMEQGWMQLIFVGGTSVVFIALTSYYIGCSKEMRKNVLRAIKERINKFYGKIG